MIEEVETLSLVLADVTLTCDREKLPKNVSAPMARCIELCKKGADNLSEMAKDLGAEIRKRRRLGSVKVVLKRGLIDRSKERLKSAQFSLMLSH